MSADLMAMYHRRSDHGRDGAPMDGFLCNCRELFTQYARGLLEDHGMTVLSAEQYDRLLTDEPDMSFLRRLLEQQRVTWNERHGDSPAECHCGEPVTYGFDGDPAHHRGMCEHCDPVRCDAYPGECGR